MGAIEDGDPRVEAHLILDQEVVPAGGSLRAAVVFEIDPDWHIYWRNSGEAGLSTEVVFGGDGLEFGGLNWAAPRPFLDPAQIVATFGFSDAVLLWSAGTIDAARAGSLTVTAEVDYLACKVECIPGSGLLKRTVQIGESVPSEDARWFDVAARQMARPSAAEGVLTSLEIHSENGRAKAALGLRCTDCDLEVIRPVERYALMPDEGRNVLWKTTSVTQNGPEIVLNLDGEINADGVKGPCAVRGVVWVQKDGTATPIEVDQPFACEALSIATPAPPSDEAVVASAPLVKPVSLWYALILAFIGGMILNLMPCVFPVLAVKVFAFVKLAHEEKSQVLSHSVAYSAGVVGSMLSLALVVVGLKMAGTQVGWGFQFQEPLFVAILSAILVLFAMNLFGAFEVMLSVQQKRSGEHTLRRSAAEGVLAVILATPCSAPFLGTAVGFALAASPLTIFAIFGVLGLGLAFPFVVLTMVPGWTRVLPKPGNWMVVFKQLLGFALLGTVVWLVWILGQSAGINGVAQLLGFLLSVAIGAWVFGSVQFAGPRRKWAGVALALALMVGTGFLTLRFPEQQSAELGQTDGWQTWSHARVAEERARQNVVFVDFTADWCITCKVNEQTVLVSKEVEAAFETHNVVKLKGDWTRRDEEIRKVLESYGKGGVPLYLVYGPGSPEGALLPELLTSKIVVDAVEKASQE